MPQIIEQWDPSLLLPQIYHHFDLGMKNVPMMRELLYNVQGSLLYEERGAGIGSMGTEAWDAFKNTNKAGELDFDQGYVTTYSHQEYPVNFGIRKNLIINDQYGVMGRNNARIGESAQSKMEIDAASIFANAFDSNFPGGDDVSLCNASHPASEAKSSSVQSNVGTSALTKAAVSATRVAMMRFKDDKDDESGVVPNELWVPPELEDKAIEIVGSQLDPDSGNNAVNPQSMGRWIVRPWFRLRNTKDWFMVDGVKRRSLVNWYNREPYQIIVKSEDLIWVRLQAKLHYSFGWDDWRWIFGHNVP